MKIAMIKFFVLLTLLASTAHAKDQQVILINPFTVPAGKLEETIQFWEKARDFLAKEPGYVSTKLHQSLNPEATYQLINIAEWKNAEAFRNATQKMRMYFKAQKIPMVAGLRYDPALYRIIRE